MKVMNFKMRNNDKVSELTKNGFEAFTKKGLVFIDFFADWCMPCLIMAPVIDELSEKFKGKIKFGKVDVKDNQKLAQKFNIHSIPNFILFKDGKPIEQFIGSIPAEELQEKLEKHL